MCTVQDQYDEWLYYYGVGEAFEADAVQQMKISLDTSNPGVALVLRSSILVLALMLMLMLMLMLIREAIFNSLDSFFDKINTECGRELEGDLDLMVVAETEPGLGRLISQYFYLPHIGLSHLHLHCHHHPYPPPHHHHHHYHDPQDGDKFPGVGCSRLAGPQLFLPGIKIKIGILVIIDRRHCPYCPHCCNRHHCCHRHHHRHRRHCRHRHHRRCHPHHLG